MAHKTDTLSWNPALYPTLVLALLAALWITVPAHAEADTILRVHIPFGFVVKDTTLPAGDYYVRQLETTPVRELEIESIDGSRHVLFLAEGAEVEAPENTAAVEFNECGGQKFLAQLWTAGSSVREQVVPGHATSQLCGSGARSVAKCMSVGHKPERSSR